MAIRFMDAQGIFQRIHVKDVKRQRIQWFAEGEGEHYVSLSPQEELNEPINENFEESVDFGIARCEFNEETEGKFRTLSFVVFFLFLWENLSKNNDFCEMVIFQHEWKLKSTGR